MTFCKKSRSITQKTRESNECHDADKWIEIGLRTGETDWDLFDKYMAYLFTK